MLDTLGRLFVAAVLAGTPLLLGAIGEILTERAGNLNLGVEGMMFMGAISGLAGSYTYEQAVLAGGGTPSGVVSALVALVCSIAAGMLGALVYSFLTISLRANQNVTGLTLTIFGTGFGNFFGEVLSNAAGGFVTIGANTKAIFAGNGNLTGVPKMLLSYNFMVYLGIILAIVMAWFLSRSRKADSGMPRACPLSPWGKRQDRKLFGV